LGNQDIVSYLVSQRIYGKNGNFCGFRWPNEPPLAGAVAMLGDYRRFRKDAAALLAARRLDPLDELTHNDFLFTVRDWMTARASAHA
jgi:hypothetical protein